MGDETIGGMFQARAARYGDRTYMMSRRGGSWKEITWRQFDEKVRRLALALIAMNVAPGDRVAIFSANSPEWQMVDMAVVSTGAADVPLYATITAKQAQYILSDSGSKVMFVGSEDHLRRVLEVRGDLPGLEKIVTMDNTPSDHPDVMTFDEMLERGAKSDDPGEFDRRLAAAKPDDMCSIVYTSGTTGDPKGAMLTHHNFMSNVSIVSALVKIYDKYTVLSFLPLSHVLERMSGYYGGTFNGCTIAHAGSMETLVDDIGEIKPHWMVSVPRLYEKVNAGVLANVEAEPPLKQKIFHWAVGVGRQVSKLEVAHQAVPTWLGLKHRVANKLVFSKIYERMGGRLIFFVSGGAPLAKEIAEFFHAMGILILEGYGLTETSPVISCNTPDNVRFGSVGRVIPQCEVKIAQDGEILVKGPNVMLGYWNKPAETAEVMEEGWFHTGDIGRFDEDGYLYITDRKKDLIVTAGGKNVAPQNIENALKTSRYIEQAAVIGDKRQFISALIVPAFTELETWATKQGIPTSDRAALISDERVRRLFESELAEAQKDFARFETVHKFTLLPEEMTEAAGLITPTLKLKRKQVSDAFADQIEHMYQD